MYDKQKTNFFLVNYFFSRDEIWIIIESILRNINVDTLMRSGVQIST